MLIRKDASLLLIIDVQERLAPAMDNPREVINNCAALIGVAKRLEIPFIITEQYPKGLGQTMVDLRQKAGDDACYYEKLEFACGCNSGIFEQIKKCGKKQIIIAGIETHICVLQTALHLQELGHEVFVVANACSSRKPIQNIMALQRLMRNGVDVVTSEMVFFEWLEKAGSDIFKEISRQYII